MKAKELAKKLLQHPEAEVYILDGFNGGGEARVINFGPTLRKVEQSPVEFKICGANDIQVYPHNEVESDNPENEIGKLIYLMGYGCY